MLVEAKILYAFSVEGKGGNPAGVVFQADSLTAAQKQATAAKLGFPESAFVSASGVADYKLEFFTPVKQIPHCGHATIATFTYLKKKGLITTNRSSKETIDGTRQIIFENGQAFMEQQAPRFASLDNEREEILASLHLADSDLQQGVSPTIVNTGNSFLVVPVGAEKTLAAIVPNREKISAISDRYGLVGFYPCVVLGAGEAQATARMFAPFYGIDEEAATGMAAGPLACFLYTHTKNKRKHYTIEQGKYTSPPSRSLLQVNITVEGNAVQSLYVGGDAYEEKTVTVEI